MAMPFGMKALHYALPSLPPPARPYPARMSYLERTTLTGLSFGSYVLGEKLGEGTYVCLSAPNRALLSLVQLCDGPQGAVRPLA